MRTILALGASALFAGCVTTSVVQPASSSVNFQSFVTVSYSVHTGPATEFGSDTAYATQTVDLFGILLGKKLAQMGYKMGDAGAADLSIDVNVTEIKEGSEAARLLVGFGAGRAALIYTATFRNRAGIVLAVLQGGKSHTGIELTESPFSGKDQMSTLAATKSTEQIAEFMQSGGKST